MKPRETGYFDRDVCKPFFHQGDENGILLVHGFTGSAAHMRKLAEGLAQRGRTVRTINLPGHAATEAEMARENWQTWLQACKEAALEMMNHTERFTVCGLSMGGVLALLVAQQMQVDFCVPISAPMPAKNRMLPLAGLMAPFVPRIPWSEKPERATQLDPAYDYGYSGFPTAKGADLYKLIGLARRNLFAINCPILCVQSDADESIAPGSADTILNGVSSEVKQKLWLHDVPHVCTISKEWPSIVEAIDKLITQP